MSAFTFNNKFHVLSLSLSLFGAIALSLPQPAVSESITIGEQQNLPPAQEADPTPTTSNQPVFDRIIPISELPRSVISQLLENASQSLALPIFNLEIISVRQVTWPDGCLGRPITPDIACTMALVDEWIVTLKSGERELVYETKPFAIPLNNREDNNIINNPLPVPVIPPREELLLHCVFNPKCAFVTPEIPREHEQDIVMPDFSAPGMWGFIDVFRGGNFDPPTAYGFRYKMVSDSLFTEIMEFPTGFAKPFGVLVKDVFLGEFQRGDRVPFSNYKDLLGNLLTDGIGVEEFSVVGLNVDPTNPTAFPLRLDFNTEIASFNMYAIFNEEYQSIPEPSFVFAILTFGTFSAGVLLKRQRQQAK
ncbi:hypothetical protein NIES2119_30175 [[Phormidium ambiguum] IAM M-71]|uniref:PEP-CTERM protein-sorting domain-containing protein n=1 Tax=[Phormidium ambiguum] IAM M-71 TaxID=454136 RepID=A0A1U7I3W5_9CYAN|nr:hypothetical protein [Phormidium ambiguum]OKH30843.1 hypothetical protein NIES2119_30175 [Phormidium ambiguum IAM M-71]